MKGTNEFRGAYRFVGDWYSAAGPIWREEKEVGKIVFQHQIKVEPIQVGRANIAKLVPALKFIEKKEFWSLYLQGTPANRARPIERSDLNMIVGELAATPLGEIPPPPVAQFGKGPEEE